MARRKAQKSGGCCGCIGVVAIVVVGIMAASVVVSLNEPSGKVSTSRVDTLPALDLASLQLAHDAIREYSGVRDSAVIREGDELRLALVMDHATSQAYAREMGDNFVRLVISFGGVESPPKKEIGPTKYSYLVGVYTPTEVELALGAKAPRATLITW